MLPYFDSFVLCFLKYIYLSFLWCILKINVNINVINTLMCTECARYLRTHLKWVTIRRWPDIMLHVMCQILTTPFFQTNMATSNMIQNMKRHVILVALAVNHSNFLCLYFNITHLLPIFHTIKIHWYTQFEYLLKLHKHI